ncbi:hypothetical protein D210916BOD24_25720 [Alteromonas sp. D210916BOD_24]|uniref:hypothetical protein n=1 Tax=Alteromonas sp. D210916BOD_24 TaxID=3157618 RepID=UPI00399D0664
MARLRRSLVNLEMLCEDIASLPTTQLNGPHHLRLLHAVQSALVEVESLLQEETESGFVKFLIGTSLEDVFAKKQMAGVYAKLTDYVITAWEATAKANLIIADNFDEGADKRLELLQVKAIKAKSQLKTVASAMGHADYEKFLQLLGLGAKEWQWDTLRARF